MHTDVVDLREFYLNPLGLVVRRLLAARVRRIWPDVRGAQMLALGYGTPLLADFRAEAASMAVFMPATQGVVFWPSEGPNAAALVETNRLPLPDQSVDRVILMHALEDDADPHGLLSEVWRVLRGNGRLLVIVPNRRGIWAHSDRTPFGTGRPYSSFQLRDTLRDHGFLAEATQRALYMPPSSSRMMLSLAASFEKYGEKLFPLLGGLLLVEAGKQVYAPLLTKSVARPRRVVLSFPPMAEPVPVG